MCNQLKVEFFKFRHFALFYAALLAMVGLGFSYGHIKLANAGFTIYGAFSETNCDTSFMFLLTLVSSWFIGSDFSNRTIQHEITLGYGRLPVLLVRELPVFLSAVILHFTYIIFTMLGVAGKIGFTGITFAIRDLFWCITIILQLMALQSIIVFLSFLCAKAPAAIAISVCFTVIMCNIMRNYFDGIVFTRSVFCLARDNTGETLIPTTIVAVLTLGTAIVLTYLVFKKREIK